MSGTIFVKVKWLVLEEFKIEIPENDRIAYLIKDKNTIDI